MKKISVLIFALSVFVLFVSCSRKGDDEAKKYLESTPVPEAVEADNSQVFLLNNNTGIDIYSIEFDSNEKEPLEINAVLPDGNEVFVDASGEWELAAKIPVGNGGYKMVSFGTVNLDNITEVTLKCEDGKYFADCK